MEEGYHGLIFEDKIEVYSEHSKPQLLVNPESSNSNILPLLPMLTRVQDKLKTRRGLAFS